MLNVPIMIVTTIITINQSSITFLILTIHRTVTQSVAVSQLVHSGAAWRGMMHNTQ